MKNIPELTVEQYKEKINEIAVLFGEQRVYRFMYVYLSGILEDEEEQQHGKD